MEEQNQNSITPLVSGNLAKTNGSIDITNKILSESVHEFHGDFEGKTVWRTENVCEFPHQQRTYGDYRREIIITDNIFAGKSLVLSKFYYGHSFDLLDKQTGEKISISELYSNIEPYGSHTIFKAHSLAIGKVKGISGGYDHYLFTLNGNILKKTSLFDFTLVEQIKVTETYSDKKASNSVSRVRVTPDNKSVVTYQIFEDGILGQCQTPIKFWDIQTLKLIKSIDIDNVFLDSDIEFINSELFIVGKSIVIYDMDGRRHFLNIAPYCDENDNGNYNSYSAASYSPQLKLMACFSKPHYHYNDCGFLQLWDIERERLVFSFKTPILYNSVKFSNRGNYLAAIGKKIIHIYDAKSFKLITEYNITVDNIAFDTEDKFIFAAASFSPVFKLA